MHRSSVILSEVDLRDAVKYISGQDKFIFDVEAQGANRGHPHLAELSWMSLAAKGICVTIPFAHPIGSKIIGETREIRKYKTGKKKGQEYFHAVPEYEEPPKQLSRMSVFDILRPLFWKPGIIKGGYGGLYDLVSTHKYFGETVPPPYTDPLIKRWLLNENLRGQLGLKDQAEMIFGVKYDISSAGACIEKVPFNEACYYTYSDAKWAFLLDEFADPQIDAENLRSVLDLEMNVLEVLTGMQLRGVRMDVPHLRELESRLGAQVTAAESAVYSAAGRKFNMNSPKQKQVLLYGPKSEGNQGLRPWKITKTGAKKKKAGKELSIHDYSTDASVLASYPGNKVAQTLSEYAIVDKILNTYVRGWLGDGEDKESIIFSDHLHTDFVQYGTVTGRFSSRAPNIQNIPRPFSVLGRSVRSSFTAEPGGKLIIADYSQMELVILAHYLEQGRLWDAFMNNIDPHLMTAAMVLGKEPVLSPPGEEEDNPEWVTKAERQDLGKTLGFAVVYGAGLGKIASMAKITPERAKEVLKKHAEMFPEIHDFRDYVISEAKSRNPNHITTLMGRKRRVPGLRSRDDGIRMGAERQVFNSLIQGGLADLIKLAMVRFNRMAPEGVNLIMTIHDELVATAPAEMAEEAARIMEEAMTGPEIQAYLKVPMKIEMHICDRWDEAK
jgi:DNA polymerase I-like protein with 3'-5' exonuclease and polymerase domains